MYAYRLLTETNRKSGSGLTLRTAVIAVDGKVHMPRPLIISSQSDYLIRAFDRNSLI